MTTTVESYIDLKADQDIRINFVSVEGDVTYATRISEVSQDTLSLEVPPEMRRHAPVAGDPIGLYVLIGGTRYYCPSRVLGYTNTALVRMIIAMPEEARPQDQRRYFRLRTVLKPSRATILNLQDKDIKEFDAVVADLSADGLQILSREAVSRHARLRLSLPLAEQGQVQALARVLATDPPEPGRVSYRLHCQFEELSPLAQEKILRYVYNRQTQLRRKGFI